MTITVVTWHWPSTPVSPSPFIHSPPTTYQCRTGSPHQQCCRANKDAKDEAKDGDDDDMAMDGSNNNDNMMRMMRPRAGMTRMTGPRMAATT